MAPLCSYKFPSKPQEVRQLGVHVFILCVVLTSVGILLHTLGLYLFRMYFVVVMGNVFLSLGVTSFYFALLFCFARTRDTDSEVRRPEIVHNNQAQTCETVPSVSQTADANSVPIQATTAASGLQKNYVQVIFETRTVGNDEIPPSYDEVMSAVELQSEVLTSNSAPVF